MATTLQVAAAAQPSDQVWPAARAFVLTLGLRIFYSIFAAVASPDLRLDPKLISGNSFTGDLISRDLHPALYALLGVWERFDTLWYIRIARHGYDLPAATVFYPLYPTLIRLLSSGPGTGLAAALFISTTATFFLFWGALRLFELDYPPAEASRAVLLWVVWPAAFVFFAGYPDSLMCALTIWSLYFARSRRWIFAGTLGMLAGSTKALGCLCAIPLLWLMWRQRDRRGILAPLLSVIGTASFQIWLALRHFPPVAGTYKTYWATSTVAPWTTLCDVISSLAHGVDRLLLLNIAILSITALAAFLGPVRLDYKLYAAAAVCLFLAKHTQPLLQSTTRYSLALFASFPALSTKLGRNTGFASVLIVSAIVNLFLFRTFLDWGLAI
jgi:hypothetical protein